jgi:hypothetical protein
MTAKVSDGLTNAQRYRSRHRLRVRASAKAYHGRNKAKRNAGNREWNRLNKDRVFARRLLREYGITVVEYNAILEAQGGRCKICGNVDKLCIDHNHATNRVRGILCDDCNVGLGRFHDNPMLLRRAALYEESAL